jgi:type IV pilus biogenesis protein CpaD/CtpE
MPGQGILRGLMVAVIAAAASGCAPYIKDFYSEAPPEPRADVVQVRHDIRFRQDDQYMSDVNGRVVDEFMTAIGIDPRQDRVVVLDRDARSAWAAQRTESVRAHLARRNIIAEAGVGGPETLGYPDTITVIVERYVPPTLDCPNWTQPRGGNAANSMHRNFGCAEAFNVQQMVANKRDLAIGRRMGPTDGDIQSLQVLRYKADVKVPGHPAGKTIVRESTLAVE